LEMPLQGMKWMHIKHLNYQLLPFSRIIWNKLPVKTNIKLTWDDNNTGFKDKNRTTNRSYNTRNFTGELLHVALKWTQHLRVSYMHIHTCKKFSKQSCHFIAYTIYAYTYFFYSKI
jgi:hypothetical protein